MNSCVASFCICFPKASCASGTSVSSPTGKRATLLPLCFHLLGSAPQTEQDRSGSKDSSDLWRCPKCGGPMMVVERLTAAEIQLRSPPPGHRCRMTRLSTTRNLLRASARSVSLCLAVLQTASFYSLKSSLRESFALSSPFHLHVSSVVLCRAAPPHLNTASSLD